MILRPYQKESISALWDWYRANPHGAPLIVAPTGSGKSCIVAHLCKTILDKRPDYHTLIVSHRKEIISQNARKLQELMPETRIGIYSAGLKEKHLQKVTFANIQSVSRISGKLPEIQLLIIDECHLCPNRSDSMYQKFIEQLRNKNRYLKILGLTATPYRLDQGSLISDSSLFTDIAYDISVAELIEQKFLSPLISRPSKSKIDLSDLKTVGYDYDQAQMEEKFDEVVIKHCKEIISAGHDRKSWLIFCSGVNHAIHTSDCLNEMGVKADYIHGDLMNLERDRKINDFKSNKIKALCNCDILTTGFDYPALEMIVLLRATKSVALYVQICGRGMRTAQEKQNCLVLDFGGNILRHGPIDCIHVKAKSKKGNKAEIKKAPIKECPACGAVQSIRVLECSCGYQFPLNTTKLSAISDTAAILSEPEILDVTWHNYKVHNKPGKPPSFKIEYGSGTRIFYDFLCFEHGGFASEMARKKWVSLCNLPVPTSTFEALKLSADLPVPETITVKKQGEFWRVLNVVSREKVQEIDIVSEIGINI